jgi:hypothetical protein
LAAHFGFNVVEAQTGRGSVECSAEEESYSTEVKGPTMSTLGWIILIIVLILLFGGGGGYYWIRKGR